MTYFTWRRMRECYSLMQENLNDSLSLM